jgi:hypothetical protein
MQTKPLNSHGVGRRFFTELLSLPHHRLFIIFAVLAVATRVIFMLYTGRIWEDALIALTSARNVWEGFGWTHHVSEPRVQSFSSVVGELIMVIGESVRQGLLAVRLASIAASVATVYFAFRIGSLLLFNGIAHTLVLSYLAMDHLQIFFGMGGMETQVVTAILLANAYFYLSRQWRKLGFALGLAILSRPEFMLWAVIMIIAVLIWHRGAIFKTLLPAAIIALSWVIFAVSYFGSYTPQTIIAKSIVYERRPFAPLQVILQFCLDWWKHVAPFREYWAVSTAPVPDSLLKLVVVLLLVFALIGAYHATILNKRIFAVIILVAGFAAYRTVTASGAYFMWYLPPFMALFFLLGGAGVTYASKWAKVPAALAACLIAIAYATPFVFALPLDKTMQQEIEIGVRTKVAEELDLLMAPGDSVVLEPLGYIGWRIRNKTIYDYPALASPIALKALMTMPGTGLVGMMKVLSPTFAVLRPDILHDLNFYLPETAANYETIRHITLEKPIDLSHWGLSYLLIDNEFFILKRKDATQ